MPILEPLPESVSSELRRIAAPGEDAKLVVSTDIDGGGKFGERWLVATKEHAYVFIPEGDRAQLVHSVSLKDVSEVNA